MCKGTGYYVNAFAKGKRSEDEIGLMRCRMLCGRTIERVDGIHLKILEDIAPGKHRGLFLVDGKLVSTLLERLSVFAPVEEDLVFSDLVPLLGSSWGRTCRLLSPSRGVQSLM